MEPWDEDIRSAIIVIARVGSEKAWVKTCCRKVPHSSILSGFFPRKTFAKLDADVEPEMESDPPPNIWNGSGNWVSFRTPVDLCWICRLACCSSELALDFPRLQRLHAVQAGCCQCKSHFSAPRHIVQGASKEAPISIPCCKIKYALNQNRLQATHFEKKKLNRYL